VACAPLSSTVRQPAVPKLLEPCPRCKSDKKLRTKLVLIDEFNRSHFQHYPDERSSCSCVGDFSVDGLRPDLLKDGPLQQFISALYCDTCEIAFVPEDMAKPPKQAWRLSKEGWHRVLPDGSLGPPERYAR
jgi:hypothetical protein